MLLFLGAGASKAFGLPDMNDLTKLVIKELKHKYNRDTKKIKSIRDKVRKYGMKPDIESILTCVDAISNPKNAIKNAGAFAAYISRFKNLDNCLDYFNKESKNKEYIELAQEIREIIREKCFLPSEEKIWEIKQTYNDFFSKIEIDLKYRSKRNYIFTTNYDICFENYCRDIGLDFFDGFQSVSGVQEYFGFDNKEKNNCILCKLHGSSNYYITENERIVKTDQIVKPGQRIASGKIVRESMVYPTNEKYFSKEPYFGLINFLRNRLIDGIGNREDRLIMILGYSFRDQAINNAFVDALKNSAFKRKRIVLIDPYAKDIIKNNIPELKNLIDEEEKTIHEFNLSKTNF